MGKDSEYRDRAAEYMADIKERFGLRAFRTGQEQVIRAILDGRDVAAVMPTGAGKSLCYQGPALVRPGLTLVVSPLISLMQNQVHALADAGIPAAFLNSTLSPSECGRVMQGASRGDFKILYVAPERLWRDEIRALPVTMAVIDEAHCISQWGHDFRPSYLTIARFIQSLAERPLIAAFTATATVRVRDDIIGSLALRDPFVLVTGFNRENLYFAVRHTARKEADLTAYLKEHAGKSGIIYCATRKTVEDLAVFLREQGLPATRYHAGLSDAERHDNQEAFIKDRAPLMVATNAFGMGIDKPNVAFVVHYSMPKNIESYYQEAGRAGRDGAPADCLLLYSPRDMHVNRYLIRTPAHDGAAPPAEVVQYHLSLLEEMNRYAESRECLRARILRYFGEEGTGNCGHCSNCCGAPLSDGETVETEAREELGEEDITVAAQKIVSCVYRIERLNRHFGYRAVMNTLRGRRSRIVRDAGLDRLSTYGIMRDTEPRRMRVIIDYLVTHGYLALSGEEYPVLRLTPRSDEVILERKPLAMPFSEEAERVRGKRARVRGKERASGEVKADAAFDPLLFNELKKVRFAAALEAGIPVCYVFSDATLLDMCVKKPLTLAAFARVFGVGAVKLQRYGDLFIKAISSAGGGDG
ncbi:MAG: DNA helicase RecQ [Spirochaetaceae bacterium]|jgi:ATP-dependent DNA helicase RecQ|nr:DNA helicase RecQ [Spirochaetaceae bacterium]